MANVGKRKAFSIEDKVKFIRKLQNGKSQSAICKEFSLPKSTVATIWKSRDSIISAYEKNINGCKRLRKAEKENVEEALFKWFTLKRSKNLPITGTILQEKANEFAALFEEKSFVCSNGWVDRFKKWHNIRSSKVVGEATSVCSSDINHWMVNFWPDIIRNYDEKDIFNTDETGLFYKLTPNQTLKFKGRKCVGLLKVRITIGAGMRQYEWFRKTEAHCYRENLKNQGASKMCRNSRWITSQIKRLGWRRIYSRNIFDSGIRNWLRKRGKSFY
ncbi:Tigger transposable element-derived protein 4 [Araneus ventricosus]|uniref:Tigger transposable element-derived protein 4 n=1 Tax=Araneus ventricosus TaxID=182803 RepID=A0A4Y2DQ32_ARAVE|nr:Tigger transposable element-derived protein 4 [Araneus ventricosus]